MCFVIALVFLSQGNLMQAQTDTTQLKEMVKPLKEGMDAISTQPSTQPSSSENESTPNEQMNATNPDAPSIQPSTQPSTQPSISENEIAPNEQKNATNPDAISTQPSTQPSNRSSISENESALIVEVYDRNTMKTVDGVEVYLFLSLIHI